jgi:hypothetical protein
MFRKNFGFGGPAPVRIRISQQSAILPAYAAVLAFMCSFSPAVEAKQKIQMLDQQNYETGRMLVYLSPKAVKVEHLELHYTFLATAPQWKLTIFNKKQNVFAEDDLMRWVKHGVRPNVASQMDLTDAQLDPVGDKTVQGLSGREYSVIVSGPAPAGQRTLFTQLQEGKYFVATKMGLPEEEMRFLSRMYSLPFKHGIPVSCEIKYRTQNTVSVLKTRSAVSQTVEDNFFDIPKGMQKVKNESAVALTKSKINEINDVFEELGVGRKPGER